MAQQGKLPGMEDELFQINGATEEGNWGRVQTDGLTVWIGSLGGNDFEGAEERLEFRECYDVLPVVVSEFKVPDLRSAGGNKSYGADGSIAMGNDI
jgi:hypothetical protein